MGSRGPIDLSRTSLPKRLGEAPKKDERECYSACASVCVSSEITIIIHFFIRREKKNRLNMGGVYVRACACVCAYVRARTQRSPGQSGNRKSNDVMAGVGTRDGDCVAHVGTYVCVRSLTTHMHIALAHILTTRWGNVLMKFCPGSRVLCDRRNMDVSSTLAHIMSIIASLDPIGSRRGCRGGPCRTHTRTHSRREHRK